MTRSDFKARLADISARIAPDVRMHPNGIHAHLGALIDLLAETAPDETPSQPPVDLETTDGVS